ncbi:MAG: hypothetical protein ACE5HS_21240 [bacterium]
MNVLLLHVFVMSGTGRVKCQSPARCSDDFLDSLSASNLVFGTLDGGLVRYDGYTFRPFKHVPGDSTSLSSSAVETIFEDSRGCAPETRRPM